MRQRRHSIPVRVFFNGVIIVLMFVVSFTTMESARKHRITGDTAIIVSTLLASLALCASKKVNGATRGV